MIGSIHRLTFILLLLASLQIKASYRSEIYFAYIQNRMDLWESVNWNYLSLLVVIGQTYTYLKDYASAQNVYENILNLEPGFLYVKDDLYPKLLKKMEN